MRSCMICKKDSIDKRYQYCLVIITVKWYNKIIVDLARICQKKRVESSNKKNKPR